MNRKILPMMKKIEAKRNWPPNVQDDDEVSEQGQLKQDL